MLNAASSKIFPFSGTASHRTAAPTPSSSPAPRHGTQPPRGEAPRAHSNRALPARDGKRQNASRPKRSEHGNSTHRFPATEENRACRAARLNPAWDTEINNPSTAICGQVPPPDAKKHIALRDLQPSTRCSLQPGPCSLA